MLLSFEIKHLGKFFNDAAASDNRDDDAKNVYTARKFSTSFVFGIPVLHTMDELKFEVQGCTIPNDKTKNL